MPLAPISIDPQLVSACGLYCGACRSYRGGKCPGCHGNTKASWCKVRACNLERGTRTCAQCPDFPDPADCAKFHNPIASLIGFVFNTDRAKGIHSIRESGRDAFALSMAQQERMGMRRRG